MKLFFRVVFLPALMVILSSGCFSNQKPVREVTAVEAQGLLKNDFAVLVDVREKEEVRNGMAKNARWFPTSKIDQDEKSFEEFLHSIPKDKEIIFYCRSGKRSSRAAKRASELGYRAGNLGGFDSWTNAGLPVDKQPSLSEVK